MPEISAFRGLRFNLARVGSLSEVVAPPYDVIDGKMQNQLYDNNPYNIIRLELTRPEPDDASPDDIYPRAGTMFRNWWRNEILVQEPDPAIYVYHQQFDYAGRTYTRRGFMARVRLERFGEGNIYPHEETHSKAKDDRLKLTRACEANLSQIFGLYPDDECEAQTILERHIIDQTPLEAVDHLGIMHRLWPVTDVNIINEVSALVSPAPMFVADGHHRYETACNYRDELVAKHGSLPPDHPANFVLTMLVSMSDFGMIVLPTHRLLSGVPTMSSSELIAKLGDCFECDVAGQGPDAAESVWAQMERVDEQEVMAFYTAVDKTWLLCTATEKAQLRMAEIASEQSDEWRGLGVAILHRLVFDDLLGLKDMPKPTYVHLVDEVIQGLNGELEGNLEYPLAALVMPATIDHIQAVSLHAERMPAKSTYFFPKLLSGLVINPLTQS